LQDGSSSPVHVVIVTVAFYTCTHPSDLTRSRTMLGSRFTDWYMAPWGGARTWNSQQGGGSVDSPINNKMST